jgi:hypothetical protein
MIKFFRKIRYDLMEQNKTGKYFKYAIGEIVLVMIGILLALQVNNWNEQRKDQDTLHEYLIKIANNIKEDIAMAEEHYQSRNSRKKTNQEALSMIVQGTYDIEILKKAENFWYEYYFKPNKSGFEALKNSVYIGKLNNTSLDILLHEYYAIVNEIEEKEFSYNNFIENIEIQFRTKLSPIHYYSLRNPEWTTSDASIIQDLNNRQEELLPYFKTNEFQAGVFRTARQPINLYRELIAKGEEFINEVNKLSNDKIL